MWHAQTQPFTRHIFYLATSRADDRKRGLFPYQGKTKPKTDFVYVKTLTEGCA